MEHLHYLAQREAQAQAEQRAERPKQIPVGTTQSAARVVAAEYQFSAPLAALLFHRRQWARTAALETPTAAVVALVG
jgi:hypothetical protein